MTRPLDGIGLLAYCRRQRFPQDTQELLAHIRSSPPSRTPGARHGNMPVWYPSKKMQCIIKAESAKVEFAFLLQAECGLPASLSSMDRLWVNDRPDNLWIKTAKWSIDLISCL